MPSSTPTKRTSTRKLRNSESRNSQETTASSEAVQQSSSQSQGNESDNPSIRRSARPPKRNTLLLEAFEEAQTSSSRQKRPRQDSTNEIVSQPDSKSKENSPFKSPAKKPRTSSKRSRLSETEAQPVVDHQKSVDQAPEVPKSPRRKGVQSQAASAKIPQIRVEPAESQEQPPDLQHEQVDSQKDRENLQHQEVEGEFVKGGVPHIQEEVVTVAEDDMQYVDEHGEPVQIKDGIIVDKDQERYEYEVLESAEDQVVSEIQVSRSHQESMSTMLESLFYSKLNIYERTFTTSNADVAINICTPDITDGYMFFDEIHALAGPRLIRDCKNYVGMQNGSCRVTRSYNASNYKCIIHTALPHLPTTTRIVDVEIAQLAIKRCLNEAVARGAQTIAFPSFFPCFSPLVSAEFLLKVISNWMYLTDQKGQLSKLREVQILCHSPMVYRIFKGMINKLYTDLMEIAAKHGVENTTLFDVYGVVFKRSKTYHSPTRYDSYPRAHPIMNEMEIYYNNQYEEEFLPDRQRRRRRNRGDELEVPPPEQQVRLELSAKLQPSVLVLDDKDGLKRQYRLTNKSKDGRKLYFRCSFCDTLIRKTNIRIRAKITLQDGRIMGDQFPKHHPDCKPKSPEELAVQQIDRKSRREVKEGILQPREAYEKARQRAMQYHHERSAAAQDSSMEMEDPIPNQIQPKLEHIDYRELPNFPEWQRIRQQYFRMRKVGEIQKHNQMQVRTDALRQATFIENDDDETMLVEVDDPDAVQAEGLVDVEMPEPRRAPRILVHHREQPPQPAE